MGSEKGEGLDGAVEELTLDNITEEKLNQAVAALAKSERDDSDVDDVEDDSEAVEPEPKDIEPEAEPDKIEPEPEAAKSIEPEKKQAVESEEIKELRSKIAKLEKANDSYGRLYGSWSNEIGKLRKALKGSLESEESRQALNDKFADDPAGAIEEVISRRELVSSDEDSDRRIARDANEANLRSRIPDIDDVMPMVVDIVKGRGYSPNVVSQFERDPFSFEGMEIISLVNEAKLKRMEARISGLLDENEKLKKGGNSVVDRLEKASKKRPVVKGSDANNPGKSEGQDPLEGLTEDRIDRMSAEEVQSLSKKLGLPGFI